MDSYNYLQHPIMPNQAQQEIETYFQKQMILSSRKMSEEVTKANIRADLESSREMRREYRKECARARYIETSIGADGEIKVLPCNMLVNIPERAVTNFKFLSLHPLQSIAGDTGLFALCLKIRDRKVTIYLDGKKVGNSSYIQKKLVAAGGEILISKKADKEAFLQGFWALLLRNCGETQLYSTHAGWIRLQNGRYQFIEEGVLLWNDIAEMAK